METSVLFSVWAVPRESDRQLLASMIASIGKEHHGPLFLPHMTLYACHALRQKSVTESIDMVGECSKNAKRFTLRVGDVGHSKEFFKCVYLELVMNDALQELYTRLHERLTTFCQYTLTPHVSLLYKDASDAERQLVVSSIVVPQSVMFDEIGYVIHDPQIHRDVVSWKYHKVCQLHK